MKKIYYDLTELMNAGGGKFRYYGIARVVAEVANCAAVKFPETVFVIHSQDHDKFFRIYPNPENLPRKRAFGLPEIQTIRYRERTYRKDAEALFTKTLLPFVRWMNLRRWKTHQGVLEDVDMSDGVFYSAARPRLILNMMMTINRQMQNVEVVPMVHDLIPLHNFNGIKTTSFGNNFYHDTNFILQNCRHQIANSQFTKDDIEAYCAAENIPKPQNITAVPLVHEILESGESFEIDLPQKPYFLMVGTMLGRKNLNVVLDAYLEHLTKLVDPPMLVLAGAIRKLTIQALKSGKYKPIAHHVEMIANPNETDLKRLYEGARGLILPSHIEGWGLPAGEALWCGTPVIFSDIPVFREVCGDLGLYFDPNDHEKLSGYMLQLFEDSEEYLSLKQKISSIKPKLRTWKMVTYQLFDVLKNT
ncbi:MAG: glycosyltransferase family 1 protein [Proteobacteria bacterium]|nr:glycosyltransferase family 1 protein [Pseudomonadota bacterium]